MEENNYVKHAKKEFQFAGWMDADGKFNDEMQEMICGHVIKLLNVFNGEGHSGSSAPYAANLFKKLALFQTITPLTGIDAEWGDKMAMGMDDGTQQNKRDSAVFRKNGQAYYIEAIVFRGQNGLCFTGGGVESSRGVIGSAQNIKAFPFAPKTFYIDVLETEWANKEETKKQKGGGWWTSKIKDESQLDEVFEYYDRLVR